MNIVEFRDALLFFRATRRRRSVEIFENAPGETRSTGGASSAGSPSARKSDPPLVAHTERLFATFMDHLPAYAWIKDLDGSYLYVNERVKQLPAFQHHCLGKSDEDLWPSERAAMYRESDLRVIETGKKLEIVDWFILNDKQRYVLVTKFPIIDENGAIIMVGGISVDITEHKRVEDALRQSESFRRMIIESEPECVKLVAPDYTLLDMNPAGLKMIGATCREQVIGQSVLDLIATESRSTFIGMHQRVCQGESVVKEFEIVGLDGSRRWMESHGAPLLDKESRVIALLAITRDVTERKRGEDRLRRSERELAEAQRIAHIGSWSWELNSKTQSWSDELYRIYGLQRGAVAPNDEAFLELVHPEDRCLLSRQVERALKTGEPIDLHVRIIRPDGEERIIHSRGRVDLDDQGNAIRKFGTAQDVTEHKRAEEALRAAEQKYRDIFENAAEGIFQTTPDGRFLSANPALVKMFGFSFAEELIRERSDISNKHYVDPKHREEFKRQLEEQGVVKGFELQAYRKDGSAIWLCENVRAVRDEAGQVVYYEGTTQDITERRQTDHSLRIFRALMDRSTDAIEVVDPSTLRFLHCNKSASECLGYSSEEFLTLSVYDIDPLFDEEMNQRLIAEMNKSGFVTFESVHRRKDGSTFPVEINLTVVRLEHDYRLAVVRDITERKSAEQALRHAEQKYRRIFENATEGIFQSTLDGKLIAANPALALMYGFGSPEEMVRDCNDIWQLYVDPSRREDFRSLIELHGVVHDFEYQAYQKDGRKIWISSNARAVRDDEGSSKYYEGTAHNITDRKQAENDLIKQKEILQTIVDHIPVMINFCGSDGRPQLVNREFQNLLGWSLEEIQNKKLEAFAECYPDPQRLQVRNFVASATGEWFDFTARTRDGSLIDTSWARVKLSDGTTLAIGQDITARKRAEQALRQAEQKYRELFENAKDATYVHDLSGKYTSINRAAEKLTGYSREEILGKDFIGFVAPEYLEQVQENLYRKLRQQGETTYEVEVITKDGHRVPVEVSSRLIYEDGVPVAVQGTARTIVERKRAEEALRGFSRQLIRAQEAERQRIARELHDQIGQVLTAIRINLQTIHDTATEESDALIDEGVTLVDEAIQQVRDLSFELRPSLLDDLGLTAALHWYADRYTQRTGIRTSTSICPESRIRLPRELETSCFRIVQEALTNVARHAQAKNVSIDVRTVNGDLTLLIKDDGVGFDSRSLTNSAPLNSLGLRGMEERVRGLGGKLVINSSRSDGTEVRVHFPLDTKRSDLT